MLRDRRFDAAALPETVQGIIAARLDALAAGEKVLVQDAAVVGKVFWSGRSPRRRHAPRPVEERLHALERKEFVRRERRSSVAGEDEYAFRHCWCATWPTARSRGRARRQAPLAAEWIESLARTGPRTGRRCSRTTTCSALELARAAGERTAASRSGRALALRDAGERALALNALPSAARFYASALELWPEDDPEWPDLVLRQAQVDLGVRQGGEQPLCRGRWSAWSPTGDLGRAADAEVLLAESDWFAGPE